MKIEDNGIGRVAAAQMQAPVHKSYGIKITEERLQIVNEIYNADAKIDIEDLYNTDQLAAGTRVTLTIKIKNA